LTNNYVKISTNITNCTNCTKISAILDYIKISPNYIYIIAKSNSIIYILYAKANCISYVLIERVFNNKVI
jgi:hypothetical protein